MPKKKLSLPVPKYILTDTKVITKRKALPYHMLLRIGTIEDPLIRKSLLDFEYTNWTHEFEEDAKFVVDPRINRTGKGYKHTNQGGKHYRSSMVPDIITTLKLKNMGFIRPEIVTE